MPATPRAARPHSPQRSDKRQSACQNTPTVVVCPSPTHDARYEVGPQEVVPEFYGAYHAGINPMTGRPW